MIHYLLRYLPSYITNLTYMLQASEYRPHDYWQWLRRTSDFRSVQHRKSLKLTSKAAALIIILWLMRLSILGLGLFSIIYPAAPVIIAMGVVLVLVEPWIIARLILVPVIIGDQLITKPAINKMAAETKNILADHNGTVIAVAGSYGKTTFKDMLETVLKQSLNVAATPGNMNTVIGISRFVKTLTGDEEVLIIEFGEYRPGDIKEFCELVSPDIGIITGVNEAHLVNFPSLEASTDNIFTLADYVADDKLFVNGENTAAAKRSNPAQQYSKTGFGDWSVNDADTNLHGTSFTLEKNGEQIDISSKLLGKHQIGPLSAVTVLASTLGVSTDDIRSAIADIKPVTGRMEPHPLPGGATIINDGYNGNPDGVKAVINFMDELETNGSKIYITPGLIEMGERQRDVHLQIGAWLADSSIDTVALMNNTVTPIIAEGLKAANYKGTIKRVDDPLSYYQQLPLLLANGDVAVIQNDWTDELI